MTSPSNKLPPYVVELLAAERAAPRPSVEAERRVRAAVAATVVATAAGATATFAATAQASAAAGVAVKAGGLGALGAKLSLVAISVGMLGTAGVVTYREHVAAEAKAKVAPRVVSAKKIASRPRQPRVGGPPPSKETPVRQLPEAPVMPAPLALAPQLDRPARPAPPARAAAPARDDDDLDGTLAGESPLIENARARIGEGNPERALALLAWHARKFPHGQLAEEREALWVQALVRKGAATEARSSDVFPSASSWPSFAQRSSRLIEKKFGLAPINCGGSPCALSQL
jgi:hypothetical protein